MSRALEASRASASTHELVRRVPEAKRPKPATPAGQPSRSAKQCSMLQLAQHAPILEFDLEAQAGTIRNHEGTRVAGSVVEQSGYSAEGTELHAHPDQRAKTGGVASVRARVLTDDNVDVDLDAPFVGPPAPGEERAWLVQGADETVVCKVCYIPIAPPPAPPEGDAGRRGGPRLGELVSTAVGAVVAAFNAGAYEVDEKTGGGYVVGGNACQQKAPPRPTVRDSAGTAHVIPYRRVATFTNAVSKAVAAVAPLMGRCAEHLAEYFPAVLEGLAARVRHHPVCGDTFMFPTHEQQREGLGANNTDSGSVAAHQLAMRLAGTLTTMSESVCNRASYQCCALHVDTDDGERPAGSPLIYALLREQGVKLSTEDEARPMRASDLIIFEGADGGRCVRIQTGCLHHVCVVVFRSERHLHGNVFPPELRVESPVGLALLRLVPYARKPIDALCDAAEREPSLWGRAVDEMVDDDGLLRTRAVNCMNASCARYEAAAA